MPRGPQLPNRSRTQEILAQDVYQEGLVADCCEKVSHHPFDPPLPERKICVHRREFCVCFSPIFHMMKCEFLDRTFDVPILQHAYFGDPIAAGTLAAVFFTRFRGERTVLRSLAILVQIRNGTGKSRVFW